MKAKEFPIPERDHRQARALRFVLMVVCLSAAGGLVQPPAAAAAITFVQVSSATPQTPQTTVAVTYPGAQSAGNLNIVVVGWGDATRSVASVTDSAGNVYAPAVGPTVNAAGALSQTIYYAQNITAAPAGGNTVTVTFNGPADYADVRALEYSGADVTAALDVTATGTGNSATSSTAVVTTTGADLLLFAANTIATLTTAPGAGFTTRIITTPNGQIAEDQLVTAAGSYSGTAALSQAGPWVMQMVAFRVAGGPPPEPDPTPPTAPSGLTATPASSAQINLAWTAATDAVGVTGYRVERCQGAGCSNFAQIATPTATTFSDTGRTASTSYSYRVRATDAAGNLGPYSNTASATTLTSPPPTGTISFVQVNAATPQTPQTTVAITYEAAQSAGNLNIVVVGWSDAIRLVASVIDSVGNVYVPAVGPTVNTAAGGHSQTIYYAPNITAAPAGGNTVTVTFTGPAVFADIRVLEYSGADVAAPVDVTATGTGSSATSSTAAVTTTNANDLLFAANTIATLTTAPGAGFTSRVITSPNGQIAEDRLVTAAGSYSATAALNQAGPWVMQMVAFRVAGGSPPDTTPPTAPSSLTATPASATQINLAWTASTDAVGVTGYRVERCQGAGCSNFVQIATPTATTFNDAGLTASTSYSYRVRATDAAANLSAYSNTASASTPALPDTTPPTAPSSLTATPASDTQINLAWTASTDAVGVTGYRVERCQGAGCSNFVQIATPTATTFNDPGLTASTSYSYRVRATDAAANLSAYSNTASASTQAPPDTTPPTAPSSLTATPASATQINLAWTASTDAVGVTGYRVERCQGAGCSNFVQIATPTATTFNDPGLTASTSYSYRVRATDAAANLSAYSNTASASTQALPDTTPPTAPSSLTATPASATQINLAWTASTDAVGVTGYRVERCQGAGCSNFVQIATPTATTFNDPGLTASTSYSYRVRATDAAANLSAYSNTASASTQAPPDTTPPTAPSSLTATPASATQINLAWTASTDAVGVTGYRVERCQGAGCSNFVQIATPTATTFNDPGLTASTSYSYRVRATDAAANLSAYSNTASASTQAPPDTTPPTAPSSLTATPASATQINLAWTASTDAVGVTGYRVERCQGAGCSNFVQIATPTATTFNDPGLTASTSYSYRVRATDAAANLSAYSNTASASTQAPPDTTPPTAPASLTATPASATQINLAWTASTDAVGVTGYRVERCQGAGCSNFVQVGTPTATTFNDTGLTASTSYSYRVRATDAAANLGPYSNTASATTLAAPPPGTISFVQVSAATPQTPQTTVAVTYANAQSAGNLNIVVVGWGDNIRSVASVTDSRGHVYAPAVGPTVTAAGGGLSQMIYYSQNITAAPAGGNTVTVTFTGPAVYPDIRILEYSGAEVAIPVDVTAAGTGNSATSSTAAVTTTNANDLLFAANTIATLTTAPGAGFTSRVITTPNGQIAEDRLVTAAGSYSATAALNQAGAWVMQMVAFRVGGVVPDTTPPTAPSSLTATPVSSTQINLAWTAATDAVGVTGYRVERCQGAGCSNFAQIATPTATTFNDTGRTASTSYSYRVRATDAAGNLSAYSNTASAITQAPDTTPPTAPSSLTATPVSSTQINLAWTAATDAVGVTGYRVERCQGAGCSNFAQIATPTATTFNDTGRTASTSYSYRVRATDAAGNLGAYSNTASAITQAPDTTPPTAPSSLTATPASASQINLAWTAATDAVGVTGYRVERCQGAGCSNFAQIATPTPTTFNDSGLSGSTTYRYRVRATDAAGNLSAYSNIASATTPAAQSNPIVIENQQPGTSAWQLGDLYDRPYAADGVGQIKGYASATSVNKGGSINFHVSVNPAQTFTIDVYRVGWYQGLGGRLMQHIGPLNGVRQPTCPANASTGMIECNWATSYILDTQAWWTSGIYLAVLRNAQGFYNYMVFAVRDDSRVGALLYQQPVTTYQAYNDYPDDGQTGKSLYEHNSFGANTIAGTKRAVKVSFDRPYAGSGAGQLLEVSEINTLRWMEKSGYDVTYSTNVDTHRDGALLLNHRGFLSLPHDEYWSKPMYDAAVAARDAGVDLAFFGANSVYWQIRFEASTGGVANRVIVCYKDLALDPNTNPALETIKWRDGPVNRPEQTLVGVQFTDGPNSGTATYRVTNAGNWVYAGTGFANGDTVPGLVWYEADRLVSGDPAPVAVAGTYTLLSHSPYTASNNQPDYANSSIYQAPSGAWVFASGTMGWGWGLDDFYPEGNVDTVDARIQRATANILDRFVGP